MDVQIPNATERNSGYIILHIGSCFQIPSGRRHRRSAEESIRIWAKRLGIAAMTKGREQILRAKNRVIIIRSACNGGGLLMNPYEVSSLNDSEFRLLPVHTIDSASLSLHVICAACAVVIAEVTLRSGFDWKLWLVLPTAIVYFPKIAIAQMGRRNRITALLLYGPWCTCCLAIQFAQQRDAIPAFLYHLIFFTVVCLPIPTVSLLQSMFSRYRQSPPRLIWQAVIEVCILLPIWASVVDDHLNDQLQHLFFPVPPLY